jgi:hypothetical protein
LPPKLVMRTAQRLLRQRLGRGVRELRTDLR